MKTPEKVAPASSIKTGEASPAGRINWTTTLLIMVMLLVFVGIGVAALFFKPPPPEVAAQYEIGRLDRKVSRLQEENEHLTKELVRVRGDYAFMVAERRCEIIDGMDDCLAAGLTRPERFRESDLALIRQREVAQAQLSATTNSTDGKSKPSIPTQKEEKTVMGTLVNLLKSLPGVQVD